MISEFVINLVITEITGATGDDVDMDVLKIWKKSLKKIFFAKFKKFDFFKKLNLKKILKNVFFIFF